MLDYYAVPMRFHFRFVLVFFLFSAFVFEPGLRAEEKEAPFEKLQLPRGRSPGTYQRVILRRLLDDRFTPVDSLKLLVLRAEFTDRKFKLGPEHVPPYDSLYYANELRHLVEYFLGASSSTFHLDWELAPGIVALSRPMGYYGENGVWDVRVTEMLMEVVEATDETIDFSRYEAFAIIHAGPGSETDINGDSPKQISSGFIDPIEMEEVLQDTLGTPGVPTNDTLNGEPFYVDNLMVWPEEASQDGRIFGALGIYAYQVGLRLGMVPLFDTTPSGFPDSQGIGFFGLMSYGLYNAAGFIPAFPCAFHRYLMGWTGVLDVDTAGGIRITDINTASMEDTALVRLTINSSEYFLVANRVHDTDFDGRFDFIDLNGNGIPENEDTLLGAEFDFFLTATTNPSEIIEDPDTGEERKYVHTGSGLMIWHVDEQIIINALSRGGYPNDNPALKGVDLEEADGVQDLDSPGGTQSFGSYLDSFREGVNDHFGASTQPSSSSNSGTPTGIAIGPISAADSVMTLQVLFEAGVDQVRSEFNGAVGDISPIPVHVDGSGILELVLAADTGLIYTAWDACTENWDGRLDTLVAVPDAVWTDSPVFRDFTGDGVAEIFISSTGATLYAFEGTGAPFQIDIDGSEESLKLRGDVASSPMMVEADGDEPPEVLVLSSDADSTFVYLIGSQAGLPGSGWKFVGDGVIELGLFEGRLVSHTARGYVRDGAGDVLDGFFVSTYQGAGTIRVHFVPLWTGSGAPAAIQPVSRTASGSWGEGYLVGSAAGDINGDGSDEMVITLPGSGLVFYGPYHGFSEITLRGERPSSAALEDINGDGVLETALRDEAFLYLFTGFGVPMNNWPIRLSNRVSMLESALVPPPPVIADIDGDGAMEIIFRAGRNLHACECTGETVTGWPLHGEGEDAGSPAIAASPTGDLYVFVAGSFDVVGAVGTWGLDGASVFSAVRRYAPGFTLPPDRGWHYHRRDSGGTGRQEASNLSHPVETFVDEGSFKIYPNPVMGSSFRVRIDLSTAARVHTEFLNIEGEKVAEYDADHDWPDGGLVPFEYEVSTDEFASGVYICRMEIRGAGWSWSGFKKFAVTK